MSRIFMSYWIWQDLYKVADSGNVDKVTEVINKYTHSYEDRRKHFENIQSLV